MPCMLEHFTLTFKGKGQKIPKKLPDSLFIAFPAMKTLPI